MNPPTPSLWLLINQLLHRRDSVQRDMDWGSEKGTVFCSVLMKHMKWSAMGGLGILLPWSCVKHDACLTQYHCTFVVRVKGHAWLVWQRVNTVSSELSCIALVANVLIWMTWGKQCYHRDYPIFKNLFLIWQEPACQIRMTNNTWVLNTTLFDDLNIHIQHHG